MTTFFMWSVISYFRPLCPAVCAEQSPGGEEHAAAEPSASLRSASGTSGHADCWPRDSFGERNVWRKFGSDLNMLRKIEYPGKHASGCWDKTAESICFEVSWFVTSQQSYELWHVTAQLFSKIPYIRIVVFCSMKDLKKFKRFTAAPQTKNQGIRHMKKIKDQEETFQNV